MLTVYDITFFCIIFKIGKLASVYFGRSWTLSHFLLYFFISYVYYNSLRTQENGKLFSPALSFFFFTWPGPCVYQSDQVTIWLFGWAVNFISHLLYMIQSTLLISTNLRYTLLFCFTWYKALYLFAQSWGTLYCFALHDKKLFFYLHKAEVQYLLQDIEALLHNMHNKQTQRNACVQFTIAYVRCTFLQGTEAWLHKGKLNTNEETEHRWR